MLVTAHPELLHPRRLYRPELESALFDMQRVYDYLATFQFQHKVSATGRVSLGRQFYSIGRSRAGQTVQVRFGLSGEEDLSGMIYSGQMDIFHRT